ncbi:MAG: hypothetical protein ACRELA_15525 [Candidatus Rokuibacteriota bacterium]
MPLHEAHGLIEPIERETVRTERRSDAGCRTIVEADHPRTYMDGRSHAKRERVPALRVPNHSPS